MFHQASRVWGRVWHCGETATATATALATVTLNLTLMDAPAAGNVAVQAQAQHHQQHHQHLLRQAVASHSAVPAPVSVVPFVAAVVDIFAPGSLAWYSAHYSVQDVQYNSVPISAMRL